MIELDHVHRMVVVTCKSRHTVLAVVERPCTATGAVSAAHPAYLRFGRYDEQRDEFFRSVQTKPWSEWRPSAVATEQLSVDTAPDVLDVWCNRCSRTHPLPIDRVRASIDDWLTDGRRQPKAAKLYI